MPKLLTVDELALLLQVSKFTIYHWVGQNAIPHVRLRDWAIRFRQEDIERWLAQR